MASNLGALPPVSQIRRELVELVLRDLLGPAGGPEEEIDESTVRDRYLAGMLAPRKQELSPEEFDELAEAGIDTPDDGGAEPSTPPARTLFPSSFGLSFSVALDATAFRVKARWGQYFRQQSQTLTTRTGDPANVWKRVPRSGISPPIPLEEGNLRPWVPDPECPEVVVKGRIRKRPNHFSVTLFLINQQHEPKRSRDQAWLFQPELLVEDPAGQAIFITRPARKNRERGDPVALLEERTMEMLYRERLEFAVGHGVSVSWELPPGAVDRALRVFTKVVPSQEVAKVAPPTPADNPRLAGLVTDMKELAECPPAELIPKLQPLVTAYRAWIEEQEARLALPEFAPYQNAARNIISGAMEILRRIEEGIALLAEDSNAAEAFRFANQAMWLQRVRSLWGESRRQGKDAPPEELDIARNRSWYPFQLAFILLNLPGITRLDHPDRTSETGATCDLLWFPTGGGKTEAYLGLAAYTLAFRRLQGTLGGRSGEHGIAVLMRYTLRLLTLQQFQRASALICASEVIRREARARGDTRWGEAPFRIGLWVGQKTTPNQTDDAAEVVARGRGNREFGGAAGVGTPHQLTNCPWCGTRIDPGQHIKVEKYPSGQARTLIFCGDPRGECPFSPRQAPQEGLPVLVVDEEIYRRLPAMVIATVDKFAQMPWNGKVQMLFGQVQSYCERHGFRSPEVEDADSHNAAGASPRAKTRPAPLVRPPDLIIQDELHLISGPLGTLVGLYETAVDRLCCWNVDGKTVRPKVIASTATIRRAADQVSAIFLRRVSVFPPPGLDAEDNFFALERPISEEDPGRLYLGICAPGRRLKAALIRVYVAFLAAAQTLYHKYGLAADPYMTLVGYFNALRELGGMRRLVDDDVRSRLKKVEDRGLAKRELYSYVAIEELTSRRSSTEIPEILDRMGIPFDPEIAARRKERSRRRNGELIQRPLDVLLATNMISVGVDVRRLGLMVVAGQPKATAEYIQATSRVGRSFPGVVCTVYNWARPRDLSHYETFQHYHATFYKHVEALSVTPFSPGALARGLTAVFVSCIRLAGTEYNANATAGRIQPDHPYVRDAIEAIARRASLVGSSAELEQQVKAILRQRLDGWLREAQNTSGGRTLGYQAARDGVTVPLLRKPGLDTWSEFTCLNSLREVEPAVNLIFADFGLDQEPDTVPPAVRSAD
jgi:hypothetical protein